MSKFSSTILPLALIGGASTVWQAAVVREGLALSDDNEMTVALLFGVWLGFTALGATLGARSSRAATRGRLVSALGVLSALMPASLLIARWGAGWLAPGASATSMQVLLTGSLLIGPTCWMSGWLYARLALGQHEGGSTASSSSEKDPGTIAALAYGVESLGAGLAGVIFGWVLLDHLLPFTVVAIASGLLLLAAASLAPPGRKIPLTLVSVVFLALLGAAPLDQWSLRWQLPAGQRVVALHSSARGLLVETDGHGQRQLLVHRTPLLVPSDALAGDQFGLLVPALAPRREHVLWLGVPPGDSLRKLLTPDVRVVDVVTGDAQWSSQARRLVPGGASHRVRWHGADERAWLRKVAAGSIDLLVIDTPSPTTMGGARLFSSETFQQARRVLRHTGVLVVTMPGHAAYATTAQRQLHATVAITLSDVFPHVLPVPFDWTFYAASSDSLPKPTNLLSSLNRAMRGAGVTPELTNRVWLRDKLSPSRMRDAVAWSSGKADVSTDDRPVVQQAALRVWSASMDPAARQVLLALVGVLLLASVFGENPTRRPLRTAVMTTGFGGLSLQLVWMAILQTAVGALYRDVATLSGAFLIATFFGTVWGRARRLSKAQLVFLEVMQAVLAAVLALVVPAALHAEPGVARSVAVAAVALVGFSTGAQVAAASMWLGVFRRDIAGGLYAADLIGAGLAAVLTYVWLVPMWGLSAAVWAVVALKLASALSLGVHDPQTARVGALSSWPLAALLVASSLLALQSPHAAELVEQLTLRRWYAIAVWAVLVGALAATLEPPAWHKLRVRWERRLRMVSSRLGMPPWRMLSVLALLPVAVIPINRCFYRVPFIFCHVCPRPCAFGILRPYLVTVAVLANVSGHQFCERVCPLGQAQLSLGLSRHRSPARLAWLARPLQLVSLLVVLYVYMQAAGSFSTGGETWAQVLSSDQYVRQLGTLAVAGALLVLSLWVRRPFCSMLCPIGATARLTDKLLGALAPRRARHGLDTPEPLRAGTSGGKSTK